SIGSAADALRGYDQRLEYARSRVATCDSIRCYHPGLSPPIAAEPSEEPLDSRLRRCLPSLAARAQSSKPIAVQRANANRLRLLPLSTRDAFPPLFTSLPRWLECARRARPWQRAWSAPASRVPGGRCPRRRSPHTP